MNYIKLNYQIAIWVDIVLCIEVMNVAVSVESPDLIAYSTVHQSSRLYFWHYNIVISISVSVL